MYIGEAARISGVTVKAIRHYEALGLLPDLGRSGSYRIFTDRETARIRHFARPVPWVSLSAKSAPPVVKPAGTIRGWRSAACSRPSASS